MAVIKQIDLAEQLAEGMGLTANGWDLLKEKVRLSVRDVRDLDAVFALKN